MTFLSDITDDARLYLRLRLPCAKPSLYQLANIWFVSPGLWTVAIYRLAHRYEALRPAGFLSTTKKIFLGIAVHFGTYLSNVLVKCDLLPSTRIAAGIFVSNRGHLVLGARSIGTGTIIHERVTIGMGVPGTEVPEIGRNVWIGPDCVVFGGITIGDGATVLPKTILTKSIPAGSVAQGNPARIVKREFDNSGLRKSLSTDCESLFLS